MSQTFGGALKNRSHQVIRPGPVFQAVPQVLTLKQIEHFAHIARSASCLLPLVAVGGLRACVSVLNVDRFTCTALLTPTPSRYQIPIPPVSQTTLPGATYDPPSSCWPCSHRFAVGLRANRSDASGRRARRCIRRSNTKLRACFAVDAVEVRQDGFRYLGHTPLVRKLRPLLVQLRKHRRDALVGGRSRQAYPGAAVGQHQDGHSAELAHQLPLRLAAPPSAERQAGEA